MSELPKTFDPAAIEAKWYAHWESTGAFRPSRPEAEPYTIVNPPPNVTGSLHIGHALDNTLQDILIRHARLQGKDALWVVGTDHAGIATQMVVERQMALHQQKRTDFSRDEFVAKVWEWKHESGGEITQQLRRLGCSMDWENERFTMDEGFSKAVVKVFVDLYNQGLLYRDKRLVNWDPGLKTAISDLEVETVEVNGKFWHFKYPLADGSGFISVATTRPETMLADMAVAVNPEDERYRALIGKQVKLPITGRLIPIVADEHADPELGSGAVKITPGHDFNDFEVGKRAGFKPGEMLNMLDAEAKLVQTSDGLIPEALLGLTVADARKQVVALIEAAGLLEKVEDRVIQTPFGDRSGVVIEPWLTDQWYVDAKTLAGPAIDAVRSGAIKVVPQSWEKTYFNWMENIQPWCVSRQLWWGHRIPAWYADKLDVDKEDQWDSSKRIFVASNDADLKKQLDDYYHPATYSVLNSESERWAAPPSLGNMLSASEYVVHRDSDVLDTWFSSALWPFGTLGWPENVPSPLVGEGQGEGLVASATKKPLAPSDGARVSSAMDIAGPSPQSSPTRGEEAPLLTRHYPGDVLVSGFDILFFWDARMIMQGLHFMKEVPFKTLYLHGLVRAADGSKMSKSKGNTVDPLGLIDQYGADALRFFMAAMESQGRDIKMDEERVKGYRNFATKLWNAARFCQANGIGASTDIAPPLATLPINHWILDKVTAAVSRVDQSLSEFRFDQAAYVIYQFVWGQFCDWYLELIKPAFVAGVKGEIDTETKMVAGWVLDQILVMLHPFMPFITEELWHALGQRQNDLIHAKWLSAWQPISTHSINFGPYNFDHAVAQEIDWVVDVISALRTARNEAGIAPGLMLTAYVADSAPMIGSYIDRNATLLNSVGRINIKYPDQVPDGSAAVRVVVPHGTLVIPLEGAIDLTAERTRLTAAITAITKERDSLATRLNNPAFVEKAKPEAVEKARADHAEKAAEVERLSAALARLG